MRTPIALLLLVAGCGANADPCAGKSGLCVGLHVVGAIPRLDQLAFTLRGNTKVERTPNPASTITLPVKVALFPPAGTTGTVHVSADAYNGGAIVGHGEVDAPLVNGRAQATLMLTATVSNMPNGDLAGLDLGDASDLAACSSVSQCLGGDGCCPAGCNNTNDSDCLAVCGNHVVEAGEACDDGNSINGDGCDPTCRWAGAMSTLSGLAGAASYADGPQPRFSSSLGGLATDGLKLWIFDVGNSTIRQLALDSTSAVTTLVGHAYDNRLVDGSFTDARIASSGNTKTSLIYLGTKLYFTDLGGNYALRVADLTTKMVTTISPSVVKNVSFTLTTDGTTLFYLDSAGNLDKWTPGDASSAQLVAASAIAASGTNCSSVLRKQGMTYVACNGNILQVTDAGAVSVYSGTGTPQATCTNGNRTTTTFANQVMGMQPGASGNLIWSSCAALRQIDMNSVSTLVGTLNMPGYGPFQFGAFTGPVAPEAMPFVWTGSSNDYYVGDSDNAEIVTTFNTTQGSKFGSSPHANDIDVRGARFDSRYKPLPGLGPEGLTTDGSKIYLLSGPTLTAVDLRDGSSADLFSFGALPSGTAFGNGVTRLGSRLYVALTNGTIHSIGTDGTGDAVFAGSGATSPPSDGISGNLLSAVINPAAITTDGADLYFLDASNLVRKINLATATVSTLAGTAGSTDIVDGTGTAAHFLHPADLTYAGGKLYTTDGPIFCCVGGIREIDVTTGAVRRVAGSYTTGLGPPATSYGDADGVGSAGQLVGAHFLATDGQSLFIANYSTSTVRSFMGATLGTTIRQLELKTASLTTMIGTRGQWTIQNGIGTNALIDQPGPMAFDAATHALVFIDREGVIQLIH